MATASVERLSEALFKLAKGKAHPITPKLAAAKERDVQDVVEYLLPSSERYEAYQKASSG